MGFNASWSMAVGGMIGGGIFTVLGVVVSVAGSWAWLSFVIGGLIALATGYSYASLTSRLERGGGIYTILRAAGYARWAGDVAAILIVGYVLTMSVYAFTFSHYLAEIVNVGRLTTYFLTVGIIALLVAINLRGVGESAGLEIVIVWGKLAILGALALIGLWRLEPDNLTYSDAHPGVTGAFVGAATIFMAYEGFQLLSYDYEDMDNPKHTLPLAMLGAIAAVIVIYVAVTFGATSLVGADTIVEKKEIALATAGEVAFGSIGKSLVIVAAVFSTTSAINATLFATARLARRVAEDGQLPALIGHENRRGVPDVAITGLGLGSVILAMAGGLTTLVQVASIIFLVVFGAVNLFALRQESSLRWVSAAGVVGALVATTVLLWHILTTDVRALVGLLVLVATVLAIRRLVQSPSLR